ncbi:hypothetical protein R6Q59_019936 [Mikania micrantha]
MPLNDPSLLTALKAQIQIGGLLRWHTVSKSFVRYNGSWTRNTRDALLLDIDSNATPTCTYVPKQLSREELIKLLLEKWITKYQQIHQTPVQTTTTPEFVLHQNGLVEFKFSPQDRQGIFPAFNMIQPLEDPRPIQHCSYDVCNCDECLEDAYKVEYDEDHPKKKKGSQNKLKKRFENGDPNIGLLDITPKQPENGCYVITPSVSSPDYQIEFPPLTPFEITQQKAKHNWKIESSTIIGPNGASSSTNAAEATLNWQSENAVAQNQALKAILIQKKNLSKNQEALTGRVHTVESIINDVRSKIQELHKELLQMEAEMKFLKSQLVDLERQHKHQRRSTINDDPWSQANIVSTSNTESSFEDNSLVASSKAPEVLPIEGVNPVSMFLEALTQESSLKVFTCVPESKNSLPDEQDFSEDFEHLFLAEPEPTVENNFDYDYDAEEAASIATPRGKKKFPRSDAKQKFMIEDIPPSKWRERSIEMLTWCSAELQFYDIDMVIKRFVTRCQGRLRDWYLILGEYRQLQLQQVQSPEEFMHIIYAEFIGSLVEHTNMSIAQASLGELYQLLLNALSKLYNQKIFLA